MQPQQATAVLFTFSKTDKQRQAYPDIEIGRNKGILAERRQFSENVRPMFM
jgi:hypothetical protein